MKTLILFALTSLAIARESLEDFTKLHEGLRLKPYHDHLGHLTIGYGHSIPANYTLPIPITLADAQSMLEIDLSAADTAVVRMYPDIDSHPKDVRFVLTAMAFQLGASGLGKFVAMHKAIDRRDYARAAGEIANSRFATQTPKRAHELAAKMMGAK